MTEAHAVEHQESADPLDAVQWPWATDRLTLRRSTLADADAYWVHRGRADVGEWLGWHPVDRADWDATYPSKMAATVAIELDGVVIGDLMIKVGDAYAQREVVAQARGAQAELGWTLNPDFQGKGYATEAVRAGIEICFAQLGLHRIEAGAFAANEPSWRLMERVGMRRESYSVKDALHRDHGWVDGVMYALLREEWERAQAR